MSKEWLILAIAAGGLGLWRSLRRRSDAPWAHAIAVALPALLVALVFVYRETILLNTRWTWSACRLAPALGWLHGFPLYSPVDHGPINGWLYGPVAALAWLPAALADSPEPALLIAATINTAFLLVPLYAIARHATPESGALAGLAFAAAAAALLQLYPTWYMASALNVDAIAAGLGAASCLLLLRENPPRLRLVAAAVLGALAVWTKQVEAPLVVAQCGWLWFARDRRTALRFAVAYGTAMLVIAALVFSLLNARDVIFNLWTVPAHHPLLGGWPAAWGELTDFGRYTFLLWAPCGAGLALGLRHESPPPARVSASATGLFLAAALVLLPTGIMATIKLGGDRNSLHSVYYLVAAALFAVAGGWSSLLARGPALRAGLVLLVTAVLTGFSVRQVTGYPQLTMLPPRCLSQEAWTFARAQPGRVYFPWDPLATLLAEGKSYHFEYGVFDRIKAGRAPTAAHLAAGLPVKPALVVYPKADYSRTMLQALPGYTLSGTTDDWLLYRASPPAP